MASSSLTFLNTSENTDLVLFIPSAFHPQFSWALHLPQWCCFSSTAACRMGSFLSRESITQRTLDTMSCNTQVLLRGLPLKQHTGPTLLCLGGLIKSLPTVPSCGPECCPSKPFSGGPRCLDLSIRMKPGKAKHSDAKNV